MQTQPLTAGKFLVRFGITALAATFALAVHAQQFQAMGEDQITIVWGAGLAAADGGVGIGNIGAVTTEGDAAMGANTARANFGVNGAGINIGIISDSYNFLGQAAVDIGSGDLPAAGVTVVKDDILAGTDEGRAMLQIVHDVAPGSNLFFHSAFNNPRPPGTPPDQTIATAINALATAVGPGGVIVDDVGILTAPRFQDGAAAQAVNAAKAAGIAYFSSAGNAANNATRTTLSPSAAGNFVNWGTDNGLQVFYGNTTGSRLVVQWQDPYQTVSGPAPGTVADYAIDIYDAANNTLLLTVDNQQNDPYEFVGLVGGVTQTLSIRARCVANCTAGDLVQLSTFNGFTITDADDTNSPTIFGHAAADGAAAIAAQFWNSPNTLETFSSDGPSQILFDLAGNPINVLRNTPLVTGPDGVSTTGTFPGPGPNFNPFFGTSASAPHVAALAALMLELGNMLSLALTPQDIYDLLAATAVDIFGAARTAVGFDNRSGFGFVDANAALQAVFDLAQVVPAPGTILLLFAGLIAMGVQRRARGPAV